MKEIEERDSLGILNENYFKKHYSEYLEEYPDSNLIMIDFKKFKEINDVLGHEMGDLFLKTFAGILSSSFRNSLTVRLHGDEFCVLTNMSEDEIEKAIKLCMFKIHVAENNKDIPRTFSFNAGSTKAEHGINNTKEKADLMMYSAKKNNKAYQKYDDAIYTDNKLKKEYDEYIKELSRTRNVSYTKRTFRSPMLSKGITQICTKKQDGTSLFGEDKYKQLKETRTIVSFDNMNIQNIIENIDFENDRALISVDYISILIDNNIFNYLKMVKRFTKNDFNNIILSINMKDISSSEYERLIEKIKELKELGFKICFDQYDSNIGDSILLEENVCDFIKIDNVYWKLGKNNKRVDYSLRNKLKILENSEPPIMAIIGFLESEEDVEYVSHLGSSNIILGGNYFSEETPIQYSKFI